MTCKDCEVTKEDKILFRSGAIALLGFIIAVCSVQYLEITIHTFGFVLGVTGINVGTTTVYLMLNEDEE